MANNNITYTPNYNLATVALDQDEVKFGDFRNAIAGTNNSNMQIIDGKMKDIDDNIEDLETNISNIATAINGIEGDITAIDTRVTALEQSGGSGGGNADYTKVMSAAIETTETADTLTIQQNPNDTSFYAMTIYGKTTSPSGMALQTGTPSPDNPAPIVGVTNPAIKVSDGTKTQSITLDGITLHSIDAASLIDTIEIDNGKVTLTHRVALMTDLNLFSLYPSGTTTTHTSIYIPTNEYLLGASNIYCNLLPYTVDGGNGYITTALAQNRIFISNVPNALTGINGDDTGNNKATALKAWLTARGIKILYVPKVATVTDITDTPLGQALLGLYGYAETATTIEFGNGAVGNVSYNVSGQVIYDMLKAILGG